MTTAEGVVRTPRSDAGTYEVLGRVVEVLCSSPGPLCGCLGFRLQPSLQGDGYVLSWYGVVPTEDDVVEYLAIASADEDLTTVLQPGDVRITNGDDCAVVRVQGVQFQIRPDPMPEPDVYASVGEYWRTGKMTLPHEAADVSKPW